MKFLLISSAVFVLLLHVGHSLPVAKTFNSENLLSELQKIQQAQEQQDYEGPEEAEQQQDDYTGTEDFSALAQALGDYAGAMRRRHRFSFKKFGRGLKKGLKTGLNLYQKYGHLVPQIRQAQLENLLASNTLEEKAAIQKLLTDLERATFQQEEEEPQEEEEEMEGEEPSTQEEAEAMRKKHRFSFKKIGRGLKKGLKSAKNIADTGLSLYDQYGHLIPTLRQAQIENLLASNTLEEKIAIQKLLTDLEKAAIQQEEEEEEEEEEPASLFKEIQKAFKTQADEDEDEDAAPAEPEPSQPASLFQDIQAAFKKVRAEQNEEENEEENAEPSRLKELLKVLRE